MMARRAFLALLVVVVLVLSAVAQEMDPNQGGAGDDEFGYGSWPGKDGAIITGIQLAVASLSGYGLQLAPGFSDSTVFIKLPLSEDDVLKKGRLQIDVYQTIEKAQRALLEYLYTFESVVKPPRLAAEDFPAGDVAFGERTEDAFLVLFARANAMILLEAPRPVVEELAVKIGNATQDAPAWAPGDPSPHLIISEEFKQAFFRPTP